MLISSNDGNKGQKGPAQIVEDEGFLPRPPGDEGEAAPGSTDLPRPGIVPVVGGAPPVQTADEEGGSIPGIPEGPLFQGDRRRDVLAAAIHDGIGNDEETEGFDPDEMHRVAAELEANGGGNGPPVAPDPNPEANWRGLDVRWAYLCRVFEIEGMDPRDINEDNAWRLLQRHFPNIVALPQMRLDFNLMVELMLCQGDLPPLGRASFDTIWKQLKREDQAAKAPPSPEDLWRLPNLRRDYLWAEVLGMGDAPKAMNAQNVWAILATKFPFTISRPDLTGMWTQIVAVICDGSGEPAYNRAVFDGMWDRLMTMEQGMVALRRLAYPEPPPSRQQTTPGTERPMPVIALPSVKQVEDLGQRLSLALHALKRVRTIVIGLFTVLATGIVAFWMHQGRVDATQSEQIASIGESSEWMNDHVASLITVFSKETSRREELRSAAEAAAAESAASAHLAETKFGKADERALAAEKKAGYAQRALEAMLTGDVLKGECVPGAVNVKGREKRTLYDRYYCGGIPTLCTKNAEGRAQSCYGEDIK